MLKSRGRVTLAAQVQARQGIVRGALETQEFEARIVALEGKS